MTLRIAISRKTPAQRRNLHELGELVGAFESETAAVFLRTAPVSEHVMLYVLSAMLAMAIVLCALVKLDRVVTSVGRITTAGGVLYVSPFDTGIVREVHVKAGDVVKKGQSLATLDPTFVQADLVQLQQQLLSKQAAVVRLEAELAGTAYTPAASEYYQSLQGGIWDKRAAEYRSNLGSFDGQIRSTEAQVAQYQADATKYTSRLQMAGDVEALYKPLLEKGYVSRLQLMQAMDERTEMSRLASDAQNQISQYRQTLGALQAQRNAFVQKWHSDTGAELVTERNALDVTVQNLQKAQKLSELTTLDSPADAVVLTVGKLSSGSVATGGGAQSLDQGPLFTLVPLDAPIDAEVNVNARDIGFIKGGDRVELKLDAYRFMQHGTAKGVVETISEGSFTSDENNSPVDPYFKIRVGIKDAHLRNVPANFRLMSGMTLNGDIMVGRRTILSYLVEGAMRTGSEAMREP